ncbi:MAG: hypothetical protein LLF76_07075 [Planctomycetaceae bacterium]|nr:hypothetical protein [Planctomycetaceae bacterium]
MFRNHYFKSCISVLLAICIFVAGCGGSHANPVDRYMPGDEKRSCSSLYAEMQTIDNEIAQKNAKSGQRDTWNVIEFIGGIFFIVPFFFMDAKGSYEQEIAALEARQKQLKIFFADNGCSVAEFNAAPVASTSTGKENVTSNAANLVSDTSIIDVQCPKCETIFKAKRSDLGKTTKCPKCSGTFMIADNDLVLVPTTT